MNKEDKINRLDSLFAYHESIETTTRNFEKIFRSADSDSRLNLLLVLQEETEEHFLSEEQLVFPSVQRVFPSAHITSLVSSLTVEHRQLIAEISATVNYAQKRFSLLQEKEQSQFFSDLATLFRKILDHTKKENSDIIPLVEGNSSVKVLIGKTWLNYQASQQKSHNAVD